MANELNGRYRAKAKTWDFGESEKGTEQIAVEFEIAEGDAKGRRIVWYGFFTEKTEKVTLRAMESMGWSNTDDPTNPKDLDKNEVELVIEPEDYTNPDTGQTTTRSRVRWVNAGGGIVLKNRLDEGKKAALKDRLAGRIAAMRAEREQAGAPSGPKEDVPF